jgi:hypothetical protein
MGGIIQYSAQEAVSGVYCITWNVVTVRTQCVLIYIILAWLSS